MRALYWLLVAWVAADFIYGWIADPRDSVIAAAIALVIVAPLVAVRYARRKS